MTSRAAAYETLIRWEKERQFSNIAVNSGIVRYELSGKERDFYTRLVYGVIERKLTLDYLIEQYTEKSLGRLDRPVAMILRLSLYQIFYCDSVPDSAAVSEGVKLAARYASRAKGYTNAILRKVCRMKEEDGGLPPLPSGDDLHALSICHSVSEAICALLQEQYPERIDAILDAYNHQPALYVQVNSSRMTPETFREQYCSDAERLNPLPYALRMPDGFSLAGVDFLDKGEAFVQDAASQLASYLLDPEPGMTVIDVCACPGGKSFSAANAMLGKRKADDGSRILNDLVRDHAPDVLVGEILAFDLHESKLSLVEKGAEKLGYDFIRTGCHDARKILPKLEKTASRVICDVPCSGLGVIAKKPEIRYKDHEEIEALPAIQYDILKTASRYLLPGGTLIYSTCTINRKENEEVVERFLRENPDYTLSAFPVLPDWPNILFSEGMLTLLPGKISDGFFIARIQRKQ